MVLLNYYISQCNLVILYLGSFILVGVGICNFIIIYILCVMLF